MAGTGSYYILCIEYTLHYTVTSLVIAENSDNTAIYCEWGVNLFVCIVSTLFSQDYKISYPFSNLNKNKNEKHLKRRYIPVRLRKIKYIL
jgi:hypothetical protein